MQRFMRTATSVCMMRHRIYRAVAPIVEELQSDQYQYIGVATVAMCATTIALNTHASCMDAQEFVGLNSAELNSAEFAALVPYSTGSSQTASTSQTTQRSLAAYLHSHCNVMAKGR